MQKILLPNINPNLKGSRKNYYYQQMRYMQNTAPVSKQDLLKQIEDLETLMKRPDNTLMAFIAKEEKMYKSPENIAAYVTYHKQFLEKIADKQYLSKIGTFKSKITEPNYHESFDTLPE